MSDTYREFLTTVDVGIVAVDTPSARVADDMRRALIDLYGLAVKSADVVDVVDIAVGVHGVTVRVAAYIIATDVADAVDRGEADVTDSLRDAGFDGFIAANGVAAVRADSADDPDSIID